MAYDTGLAERVRNTLNALRAEFIEKKMFGGITFMVNDHMSCGVLKTDLIVKLSVEEAAAALASRPHVRPMDFTGKPMKSMLYVSAEGCDSDDALQDWVEQAAAFAKSQPHKGASSKKPRNVSS